MLKQNTATVAILLSTLGAVYQWPHLRPSLRTVSWQMFGCLLGFYGFLAALQAMGASCDRLAKVRSLQTESALYTAASTGNLSRTAELLTHGRAKRNIDFGMMSLIGILAIDTPLIAAAKNGYTEIVRLLLEAGANPNSRGPLGFRFGLFGAKTPLGEATREGQTESVEALLEAGADPNAGSTTDYFGLLLSMTPLSEAARLNHAKIAAALANADGVDPDARWTAGWGLIFSMTPLFISAASGHTDIVEALIKAGADPNILMSACIGLPMFWSFNEDVTGACIGLHIVFTALDFANMFGHLETVAALRKAVTRSRIKRSVVPL